MNVKYAAQNTYLYIGDAAISEAFFKVNAVQDISGPKAKADIIDVSTQDETDHYHDYLQTMLDAGEITFKIVFDPNDITHNQTATVAGTNAGGLQYLFNQRSRRNMRIWFSYTSPSTRRRFVGGVTGFQDDAAVKGALQASITVRIFGGTTLEAGTGTGS